MFEQFQGDASQEGEALGVVAHANTTVIFVEGHVQHSVAAVFDRPMGLDLTAEFADIRPVEGY